MYLSHFIWQVFNAMNSYDLGCSAGGGRNSIQVFADVGLAFISDTIQSSIREGKCSLPFRNLCKTTIDVRRLLKKSETFLLLCCKISFAFVFFFFCSSTRC